MFWQVVSPVCFFYELVIHKRKRRTVSEAMERTNRQEEPFLTTCGTDDKPYLSITCQNHPYPCGFWNLWWLL